MGFLWAYQYSLLFFEQMTTRKRIFFPKGSKIRSLWVHCEVFSNKGLKCRILNRVIWSFRPLHEVYHLWRLAGGDLEGELKKRGLIKTKPPIMTLPMYVISFLFCYLCSKPPIIHQLYFNSFSSSAICTRN